MPAPRWSRGVSTSGTRSRRGVLPGRRRRARLPATRDALEHVNYAGFATIEQDRRPGTTGERGRGPASKRRIRTFLWHRLMSMRRAAPRGDGRTCEPRCQQRQPDGRDDRAGRHRGGRAARRREGVGELAAQVRPRRTGRRSRARRAAPRGRGPSRAIAAAVPELAATCPTANATIVASSAGRPSASDKVSAASERATACNQSPVAMPSAASCRAEPTGQCCPGEHAKSKGRHPRRRPIPARGTPPEHDRGADAAAVVAAPATQTATSRRRAAGSQSTARSPTPAIGERHDQSRGATPARRRRYRQPTVTIAALSLNTPRRANVRFRPL